MMEGYEMIFPKMENNFAWNRGYLDKKQCQLDQMQMKVQKKSTYVPLPGIKADRKYHLGKRVQD